jgi:hypothetical protein
MLTKERRSLWFDWFDRLTNRLSKYTNRLSNRLVWFDRLTNRLSKYTNRLSNRLVSLSNHRHRSNASAYFVDHFPNNNIWAVRP